MIQNALEELNEKWGSTEESISKYLEKRYDDLPWAHSAVLKHHLEKTCESGDIVLTRAEKYRLAGSLKLRTRLKSKPRRRKWRWECERQKHNLRKSNKRNQQRGKKGDGKKHQESDEKEQCLTENGEHGLQDQTKSLLSCVDGERSVRCNPIPTFLLTNGKKCTEDVRSQLENGPYTIAEADIWAAHAQEHQKKEQSEHGQPQLSSPERPPGFEFVRVENLDQLGSTVPEPEPAFAEVIGSTRSLRQRNSDPGTAAELVTPHKAGKYDSLHSENMAPNQQQTLGSVPITLKQMHHEKKPPQLIKADAEEVAQSVTKDTKLMRYVRRGWKRKNKPKISKTTGVITEQDPQELLQEPSSYKEEVFQGKLPRRTLRACPAKLQVAKDANSMDALPPEITVRRRQVRLLKQRPRNQSPPKPLKVASLDELQDPPKIRKLRIILKQKPEAADVENLKVADDCREQESNQSGKLAVDPCKTVGVLLPDNSKQHLPEAPKKHLGRLPKRRSARLLQTRMKPTLRKPGLLGMNQSLSNPC